MERLPALPALPSFAAPRTAVRPPRIRRPATYNRGPRWYQAATKTFHTGGPGEPPAGFVGATTSGDEWPFYWASMRVLDPDRDPRQPPFFGGKDWSYQSPEFGSYTRALGSAVVDFLYFTQYPPLAVRIQTYRFHLAAPNRQQAHDAMQLTTLMSRFDVVDVYSSDYISDPTGQAAVVLVKEALGLVRRRDPLASGSAILVRNPLSR